MLSSRLGCKTSSRSEERSSRYFIFPVTTPLLVYVQTGRQDQFLSLPLSHARSGRGGGRRRRPGQKAPAFAASEWEEKGGKKKKNLNVFQPSFFSFFKQKTKRENIYPTHTHTHTTLPFDLPSTYTRQPDLFIHLTPSPLKPLALSREEFGRAIRTTDPSVCCPSYLCTHTHILDVRERYIYTTLCLLAILRDDYLGQTSA